MSLLDELREQLPSYPTPVPYIWVPKGRGRMDAIAYRVVNHMIRCHKVKLWQEINNSMAKLIMSGEDHGLTEI